MTRSLLLTIAGVRVELFASARVQSAVLVRYRAFVTPEAEAARPAAVVLEVRERDDFQPALERDADAAVEAVSASCVRLTGGARGGFDLGLGRGFVDDARGLGAFDSLLRVALSLVLPTADGASGLLVHGAFVPVPEAPGSEGGSVVFTGASGAGKSTVARALGAACDELVVLRPGAPLVACATPYWQGRPLEASCRRVVCLRRSSSPVVERLAGARAARRLAHDVVRYVTLPSVERAIFERVARVCESAEVYDAACPEGDAFLPFVTRQLSLRSAA